MVGGKGRSLSRLSNAGFRVPGGFIATTAAYRAFVAENGLQQTIERLATPDVVSGVLSFEGPAERIAAAFAGGAMSDAVVAEIRAAYAALEGEALPLAVRSSANAEDLPGLSFAGQHSSFLNVRGAEEVVAAVKACWASLWTAQAIAYRHQNGVDHAAVAMAVVAQQMVPSAVRPSNAHCWPAVEYKAGSKRPRAKRRCGAGLRHHVHRKPRHRRPGRDHHQC